MRKLFIAASFLFAVQFASAQSADFKKDMLTYINISGTSANFDAFLEPVKEQIPEGKRADFKKEFKASLPSLYDKMADVMMKHFTHDDVKKMIEFYNSPVGKKIQEKTPLMIKEQGPATQEWQMQLQGLMMKYMQ